MTDKKIVVCQLWEESERGWGVRPDGFSVHLTKADREAYVNEYVFKLPDAIPEVYSRVRGLPYMAEIDDMLHAELAITKNGIRVYVPNHPERASPAAIFKAKKPQINFQLIETAPKDGRERTMTATIQWEILTKGDDREVAPTEIVSELNQRLNSFNK